MYLSAFTVSVYFMNIVVSIVILLSFIILYLSSKNKLDKGFIDKEKHRVNIIWYLILYFILTITCNYTIYQTGKFEFGDYIGVFIIIALYISEILSGNLKIEIQYDSAKDTRKELENS
jgi:Na+-transporting NADH:ubiquinone oxidoreductase subunit NqrB